jgi:hypothetical protein
MNSAGKMIATCKQDDDLFPQSQFLEDNPHKNSAQNHAPENGDQVSVCAGAA